jgi:anaerobic magnesium-protoporphyrin IX monomethyl ester cyclase
MKVLLTNAPLQFYHRTAFFFRDQGAVNLAILATVIKDRCEVRIIDNWHHWYKHEGIFYELARYRPDVVGISHTSEVDTENIYAVAKKIKQLYPGTIIIAGGQYPTIFPEEALRNGFDYVVRGEGEVTFPELIDAIAGRKRPDDVPGISYLEGGRFLSTPDRPAADLNSLPFPSLEFVPSRKSWFFPGKLTSVIETARGCPYSCDFCSVTAFFRQTWQKRGNSELIEEIKRLKNGLGIEHFYFIDECWGIRPEEYADFCRRLIAGKLNIRWFPSGMRTDTIVKNPGLIKLAAGAGMYGALIGFESYTDRTLSTVHKQQSASDNIRASEIMRENGLVVYGTHIYGLPGETSFWPTFREGSRRSDVLSISMFSLLPGTPLFKKAGQAGLIEKIPLEKRFYPYSYFMKGEGKDLRKMTLRFLLWHLLYRINPVQLWETMVSTGVKRRFKLIDYLSCVQYCYFYMMRKLGFNVLND